MLIVAVAWIYVVGLMAITEPTVVAGIMTFFAYCVLPLSIVYYIFGRRKPTGRPRRPGLPINPVGTDASAQGATPPDDGASSFTTMLAAGLFDGSSGRTGADAASQQGGACDPFASTSDTSAASFNSTPDFSAPAPSFSCEVSPPPPPPDVN